MHTRNGDAIELHFRLLTPGQGHLSLGFLGWKEEVAATWDFRESRLTISSADCTQPQPLAGATVDADQRVGHVLEVVKREGDGSLVKNADVMVYLNGQPIVETKAVNVLPELGVVVGVRDTCLLLERFVHRGLPSDIPESFHVGGWQVLNQPSIEENLASIKRGLHEAVVHGVQLLITPETALTGWTPGSPIWDDRRGVAAAEAEIQRHMAAMPQAPHLILGLPLWESIPQHRRAETPYNGCRLYEPDGHVATTFKKIHDSGRESWHGYRLNEASVCGVPLSVHICHDALYPEVYTLPVMFGSRLIVHPTNGGTVRGSIDAFETRAHSTPRTSHAFFVLVNGGGGSFIAHPDGKQILARSAECRRDQHPEGMVGEPEECMIAARIRIADAFGYWPVRSYRASEEVAAAYVALYRAMGGCREL